MNKRLWFLFGWLTDILVLFLVIVIPKSSEIYSVLYSLTMYMIFIIPLFLILLQGWFTLAKDQDISLYNVIPNIGCSLVIMLTFVNFVGSIEKMGRAQMVTILFLFVVVELLLGYIKLAYNKMTKKQFVFIEVASYASLVLFFICAMIMSFDFGII